MHASQGSDPTPRPPDGGGEQGSITEPMDTSIATSIDAARWAERLAGDVHVDDRAVICDGLVVAQCPTWYAAHEIRRELAATLKRLQREYLGRVYYTPTSFPLSGDDPDAMLHEAELRDSLKREDANLT